MGKAFGIILLGGAAYLIYEMYFSTPAAASTSTVAAAGVPPTGTTYVPTTPAPNSVTTPVSTSTTPTVTLTTASPIAQQLNALAMADLQNNPSAPGGGLTVNQWLYYYQQIKNNNISYYGTPTEEQILQNLNLTDAEADVTIISLPQFVGAMNSAGLSGLGGLGLFGEMMYNRQGVSHSVFGYHN